MPDTDETTYKIMYKSTARENSRVKGENISLRDELIKTAKELHIIEKERNELVERIKFLERQEDAYQHCMNV